MAGTPASVSGVRTTSDFITSRKVQDVLNVIFMLEDDRKSLTTFLSKLGVRQVTRPDFEWLTDEILPKSGTMGASAASSASGVSAELDLSGDSTAVYLKVDDVIKWPSTGEIARVSATPTSMASCALIRAVHGDATATIASGAQFVKIGNARAENSLLRSTSTLAAQALSTKEVSAANYVQTFRNPVALSRRDLETGVHGPADRKHQRAKKLLEHCEEIENAIVHGVSGSESGGRTYTRGIINMVPSGNTEAITTLDESELDSFLRQNSRYFAGGSFRKVLGVSRYVHQLISSWAAPAQRITTPGSYQNWGVSVKRYMAGCGVEVDLLPMHALEGVPGSSAIGTWDGYAVLMDMTNLRLAKFGNTYMKLAVDLQEGDRDGVIDEYISDVGLQGGNLSHHGLITGVTG